ncbi:MAG: lysine biosynthesis protein LysW [Anaerolineae bacterium]|jgi:lysine biosynthesis protein LysW|nr:lysine biosynthesis protein LysW [Anaerolineae bacterium]
MAFAYCPDCASRIYLGRKPWLNQPAFCDQCEADLEVVRLNPPVLDWVDEVADDPWQQEPELLADAELATSD